MSQARIAIAIATLLSLCAIVHADPAPSKITIAVLPFQVLAPAGSEWMGRAMQEGLATGLQKSPDFSASIVAGLPPADANSAIALAKSSGATYVVFGSIQLQDDQMRVTGQIISATTGQSIGSLKSDASQRDLFNTEDLLADRCQRLLAPAHPKPSPAQTTVRPTLDLVGPSISSGASRYFDGNLMSQITPPADRYRDDYDRYYYQSADTSACGYIFGCYAWAYPCYGWGWGGGCGGRLVYPVASPISGW